MTEVYEAGMNDTNDSNVYVYDTDVCSTDLYDAGVYGIGVYGIGVYDTDEYGIDTYDSDVSLICDWCVMALTCMTIVYVNEDILAHFVRFCWNLFFLSSLCQEPSFSTPKASSNAGSGKYILKLLFILKQNCTDIANDF